MGKNPNPHCGKGLKIFRHAGGPMTIGPPYFMWGSHIGVGIQNSLRPKGETHERGRGTECPIGRNVSFVSDGNRGPFSWFVLLGKSRTRVRDRATAGQENEQMFKENLYRFRVEPGMTHK